MTATNLVQMLVAAGLVLLVLAQMGLPNVFILFIDSQVDCLHLSFDRVGPLAGLSVCSGKGL